MPQESERATRLWRMSPTIATRFPLSEPSFCSTVNMSSSACVGCSCAPSPALTTIASVCSERNLGTPVPLCRTTTTSIFIDSMFLSVSSKVSPFWTLELELEKFTMSAESLFSASSKLVRVRVLFSKNRFTIVSPRRDGTFFTGRSRSSRNSTAVSRIARISLSPTPSSPKRCRIARDDFIHSPLEQDRPQFPDRPVR